MDWFQNWLSMIQTATAEGRIVDAAGNVYAHGSATCILFRDLTEEK